MESIFSKTRINEMRLLWNLASQDFHCQYIDSRLGLLWAILKPFVLVSCYAVVFSSIIDNSGDPANGKLNFGFFLFAGMLPWFAVHESIQRGMNAFVDYHTMVRHHVIPLYCYPFHIVLSATASQFIALCVFVGIKVIFYGTFSFHFLLIFLLLPFQMIFCLGLSLIASVLTVFLRDTAHFITAFLYIWLFASPIIFPIESMPQATQKIIWLNPLTSLTDLYRSMILYDRFPAMQSHMLFWLFSLLSLGMGVYFYKRFKNHITDWI